MDEDKEPIIEFNFPILMKIGTKVKVNKSKVDQTYFECPEYILNSPGGEVMGHANWTPSTKVVNVKFEIKNNSGKTKKVMSYNVPNCYLEIVK